MKLVFVLLLFTLSLKSHAQISVNDFRAITQIFHAEYDSEIQNQNAKLLINNPPTPDNPDFWFNLETVRAAYSSDYEGDFRTHYLFLLGGFGKLPS